MIAQVEGERMRLPHIDLLNRPIEFVKDAAIIASGAGVPIAWMLDMVRGVEGAISGALVIVLLLVRIRRHLRVTTDVSDNRP